MDLFGEDLIEFMDTLNIEKAILCGLSMGGFIALNVQSMFPHRISALILCDTQCIPDTTEVRDKRYKIIEEIHAHGAQRFNEDFTKSVFHKDSLTNKKELVNQLSKVVFANSEHIIRYGLVALAERNETCSTLNEISIPTLIICGQEDTVTPLKQSEFLQAEIKGSVLQVIENAGHVSNLEQPLQFNKHLQDFLSTLSGVGKETFGESKLTVM